MTSTRFKRVIALIFLSVSLLAIVGFQSGIHLTSGPPYLLLSYAEADLPTAGTAGRLARVTDGSRGVWMDQGSQWFGLSGEVFNVKEFGETGTVDDSSVFQSAIDAIESNGSGTLLVPEGTYIVTALTIQSGVKLLIKGTGNSTLKLKASGKQIFIGTDFSEVRLQNLRFDGNRANATAGTLREALVDLKGYTDGTPSRVWVENSVFYDTTYQALRVEYLTEGWIANNYIEDFGTNSAIRVHNDCTNVTVIGNVINDPSTLLEAANHALNVSHSAADSSSPDQIILEGNHLKNINSNAIQTTYANNVIIRGNHIDCTDDNGNSIKTDNPQGTQLIEGNIIKSGDYGIFSDGNATGKIVIRGNYFESGAHNSTTAHVRTIDADTLIDGNVFDCANTVTGLAMYANRSVAKGNSFYNSTTTALDLLNSGTSYDDQVVSNNHFYNCERGIQISAGDQIAIYYNHFQSCGATDDWPVVGNGLATNLVFMGNIFLDTTYHSSTAFDLYSATDSQTGTFIGNIGRINTAYRTSGNQWAANEWGSRVSIAEFSGEVVALGQVVNPSIANGRVFKTANTGSKTISDFTNGVAGQVITVLIQDTNTTIDFTGTNLKGNGGADWSPTTGDHMTCVYDGTNWYCEISDNTA